MKVRRSHLLAALCCAIAALSSAASDLSTISGVVRDESGKPLAAVAIVLTGAGSGTPVMETTSDATGEYRFSAIAPGDYALKCELHGYATKTQPIHLPSSPQPETADFTMTRISPATAGDAAVPSKPQLQLQASGIRGLIDPGGYSASASVGAATGLLQGMASVKRTNRSLGVVSAKDWPCSLEPKLQEAVAARPDDEEALRTLGHFYLAHNQAGKAIPLLEHAVQLNDQDYAASKDLGIAWLQSGQFENARKVFSDLTLSHDGAEIHQLLAQAYEGLTLFAEAAREYRTADKEDPSEESLFGVGYERMLSGSRADALTVFEEGEQRYPRSILMRIGTGTAEFLLNNSSQAIRAFLEATDINPGDPRPYAFLASASGLTADLHERVQDSFKRYAEVEPQSAQANYYYALFLSRETPGKSGAPSATRIQELLERALQLDPTMAEAHFLLADLHAQQGDYKAAVPEYEAAIRLDSGMREAHYRLAFAYTRAGTPEQSAREMQIFQQQKDEASAASGSGQIDLAQFISVMGRPSQSDGAEIRCGEMKP